MTEKKIMKMDKEKIQLIKDTICKGSTDTELELFFHICQRSGLDPLAKHIYPVKRWDSTLRRETTTHQISIDGYRLIAERTGRYAPGKRHEFRYDGNGHVSSAVAFVKKKTDDGIWHEVSAEAHFSEYCAWTKAGAPNNMWKTKPHVMLGKCAEALALRRAFPAEMSGLYTHDEMAQADSPMDAEVVEGTESDNKNRLEDHLNALESILNDEGLPSLRLSEYLDFAASKKSSDERPIASADIAEEAVKHPKLFVNGFRKWIGRNQDTN